MRYQWRDIPALLHTPVGRRQFLYGVHYRAWPLLSRLATLHRLTLGRKTRVVTVVGSFGKTTTASAVVTALGGRVQLFINFNAWSFLACAVLRLRPHDRHAVIEVGIDGTGQMASYAWMIRPDITVVTSIGSEHNRSLRTLEVTRTEKSEMERILPATGIAVINADDPNVRWMAKQTCARIITFGFCEASDIRASEVTLDWPHGTRFRLHAAGVTRDLRVRLIGRHMVYPILAAVAVALAEGFALDHILPALEELTPTPGRLEPVQLGNGALLLRDDCKSPVETVEAALDVLFEIPANRRIVVLGEMQELAGSERLIYRHIGERIARIASLAIFIGRGFQPYAAGAVRAGFPRHSLVNVGRSVVSAFRALSGKLGPGDVVLIKDVFPSALNESPSSWQDKLSGATFLCAKQTS